MTDKKQHEPPDNHISTQGAQVSSMAKDWLETEEKKITEKIQLLHSSTKILLLIASLTSTLSSESEQELSDHLDELSGKLKDLFLSHQSLQINPTIDRRLLNLRSVSKTILNEISAEYCKKIQQNISNIKSTIDVSSLVASVIESSMTDSGYDTDVDGYDTDDTGAQLINSASNSVDGTVAGNVDQQKTTEQLDEQNVVWTDFFFEDANQFEEFVIFGSSYVATIAIVSSSSDTSELNNIRKKHAHFCEVIENKNDQVAGLLKTGDSSFSDFRFIQIVLDRKRIGEIGFVKSAVPKKVHEWLIEQLMDSNVRKSAMTMKGEPRLIKDLIISNWLQRTETKLLDTISQQSHLISQQLMDSSVRKSAMTMKGVARLIKDLITSNWLQRTETKLLDTISQQSHLISQQLMDSSVRKSAMTMKGVARLIKDLITSNWLQRTETKLLDTISQQDNKISSNMVLNEFNRLLEMIKAGQQNISKLLKSHPSSITEFPSVNFDYEWEVTQVKLGRTLTQQILFTGKEKRLTFKNTNPEGETHYVRIIFLENCLLGKRRIHLEIVFPSNTVKLRENEMVITPVVYISLEKHTQFLRRVEIELPIFDKDFGVQSTFETRSSFRKQLSINEHTATIKAFDFSPAAVIKFRTAVSVFF